MFEALTDIQFNQTSAIPKMFELKFHKNDTWYAVHASESRVTASTVSQIYVLIILYLIVFVILSEFHLHTFSFHIFPVTLSTLVSIGGSDINQPVSRHFNNGYHGVLDMKIRVLFPQST